MRLPSKLVPSPISLVFLSISLVLSVVTFVVTRRMESVHAAALPAGIKYQALEPHYKTPEPPRTVNLEPGERFEQLSVGRRPGYMMVTTIEPDQKPRRYKVSDGEDVWYIQER
jgi:hypothetical protein